MKKIVVILFAVLLLAVTANAQGKTKQEWREEMLRVMNNPEPTYVYKTLEEVEFKIPNAEDVIAKCLHSFSPEYRDWTYTLVMSDIYPDAMVLVGSGSERDITPFLEHLYNRIGYITIDGKDIDVYFVYRKEIVEFDAEKLFRKTGNSKEFRYQLYSMLYVDGDVEYHIDITDDALVPKKKIESR